MGIAFDAASDGGRATAASQTWSHVNAGDFLVVGALVGSVENMTSGTVTYNGDALTMHGTEQLNHAGNYKLSMWYRMAPDIGTANIVATPNSASDTMCVAASYSGVLQTGFPDAYAYNGTIQATPRRR